MAQFRPRTEPVEAVRFVGIDPFGYVVIDEPTKPAWLTEALAKPAGSEGAIDIFGERLRVDYDGFGIFAEAGNWLAHFADGALCAYTDEVFTNRFEPLPQPSQAVEDAFTERAVAA